MSEQHDSASRVGTLVVGIILLVVGLSFLGDLGWGRLAPAFRPMAAFVGEVQRWTPGLGLVVLGVLLVVYGSRGGLHMHKPAPGTKLHRSHKNKMVAGVLGGLGEYLSIDPTLLRLAFVALVFLTDLPLVIAYIIMAIVVPYESEGTATVTAAPAPPAAPVAPAPPAAPTPDAPAPPAPPQG